MDAPLQPEFEDAGQGHDCVFVETPPEQFQTDCPICLLVLRDPSQVGCCGNVFCTDCVKRSLRESNNACPLCNEHNPATFLDKHLKRKLSEFQVYCKHWEREGQGEEDSCPWRGELGRLDEHLNTNPTPAKQMLGCLFVEICCKFCGEKHQRRYINHHQVTVCPQRDAVCPYCNYRSTYEDMADNHLQNCPDSPTQCHHCTLVLPRSGIDLHINNDCVLAPIVCDFQPVGCQEKLPRLEMEAHIKEHRLIHAQLLIDHTTSIPGCGNHREMIEYVPLFKSSVVGLCKENTELASQNVEFTAQLIAARKEMSNLKTVQLVLVLAVAVLLLVVFKLIHLHYYQ